MSDFKSIDFGKADANKERGSSTLLLDGFFDNGYIDQILKGEKYFVIGLKGSGKSAIGSRLELLSREKGDMKVLLRDLNDFDYTGFGGLVPGTRSDDERYHDAWRFLLSISFIGMYDDEALDILDREGNYKNVAKGLKEIGLLPDKNFNNIIDKIKRKNLNISAAGYSIGISNNELPDSRIKKMISNTNNALISVSPKILNLIVIDGLDSVLTKRQNQYKVLSGLIYVADRLNTLFSDSEIKSRVVVLCRTDVLDKLSDPNKTKYIIDSGLMLNWYQSESERIEDNNLCKLVNRRASASLKREVDVFKEFFPKTIGKGDKPTAHYLLDRTRHMPRDIIQLMNFIQRESGSSVTERSIRKGINRYSEEYFLSEIRDDFVGFLTDEEVDGVLKIIRLIGYTTTTIQEMERMAKSKNIDVDLLKILEVFYDEGVIGNIEYRQNRFSDDGPSIRYHYRFRNKSLPFNETQTIHIHAGLHKALNLNNRENTPKYNPDAD
ncbi:P-loop ATPase, Sll1717 family [Methanomethylophilus alvi]|uniref:P-loop ATPase, Sll1717 family n=1 Tax=Methanomethylophilus alvi TaxID=1291540 RepID=UPI0037DDA7C4